MAEEYIDIIIKEFTDEGFIVYEDFETGEIITDPFLIEQVANLDGLTVLDGQAIWNDYAYIVYNPSVIVTGGDKYNESITNMITVGGGNTVSDYSNNISVFGNNNTINDAPINVFLQGNQITTYESSNTTVLYNLTESRIVTQSFNNVIINPIKDVGQGSGSFTDPTGSVYIGNLVNQGTAQFRDGANVYNYLNLNNIPVALSVNGSAIHTLTQLTATPDTAEYMSFGTVLFTNNVNIEANTITIQVAGTYNIQFSAQLVDTSAGTEYAYIWLRKNNVDVPNSNTKIRLQGNNDAQVAAWNWMDQAVVGDYYNIMWAATDTNIQLLAEPSSSFAPAIPSTIVTINRV
jgi:hypothetical protein